MNYHTKKEETFIPSDDHWKFNLGLYKERLTRQQLRYMLLNSPEPIYQGKLHTWKNKHVGAGIYEIWISEEPKKVQVRSI